LARVHCEPRLMPKVWLCETIHTLFLCHQYSWISDQRVE